ncbi:MAG: DUF190 domain-containing protein [Pirellulales bacterium]|nr:DUF190 domain-containing protein [Pirellulales bacterium]
MKTERESLLLRIFINESDRHEGRPLYETLLRIAKEKGLAGATALRAIEGYGTTGRIHTVKVLHLSEDVPIVIEIIDTAEQIAVFLPVVERLVLEGTVTIEKVHAITFSRDADATAEILLENEILIDGTSPSAGSAGGAAPLLEFTDRAHQLLQEAREAALQSHRAHTDSVDLLLAMLMDPRGITTKTFTQLGLDSRVLARALRETVSRDELPAAFIDDLKTLSILAAQWLNDEFAGVEHLLLALCQIRPTAATDILMRFGAQPRDVSQEVLNLMGREGEWQRWLADHPVL